jgi:hypothetical protein
MVSQIYLENHLTVEVGMEDRLSKLDTRFWPLSSFERRASQFDMSVLTVKTVSSFVENRLSLSKLVSMLD